MLEISDDKITQDKAERLIAPMELDLTAVFKIIENDIISTIDEYDGNSVEELIKNILDKVTGTTSAYEPVNKSLNTNIHKAQRDSMPKPKPGESKQEFVSRCIPIVMDEGKPQDQATAICYSKYEQAKKSEMFGVMNQYINKIKDK